ncbi:unnamed protein product [Anisakis simplex]|uniref:Ovule protein n=2 Tax=Anisakis simplex TaxID=6269 RepID=A0A0M3JJX2_ANISI|nr:unnamed protein product [Anisakis simplex]
MQSLSSCIPSLSEELLKELSLKLMCCVERVHEEAEQYGRHEEVEELQRQIDELESRASELVCFHHLYVTVCNLRDAVVDENISITPILLMYIL